MTITEPTTEPMTTVVQAVHIPTATVEAIANLRGIVDAIDIDDVLEAFHRDHLPIYSDATRDVGDVMAEECDRVTGYDELHIALADLAGALMAAVGETGFGASRPTWALTAQERELEALSSDGEQS